MLQVSYKTVMLYQWTIETLNYVCINLKLIEVKLTPVAINKVDILSVSQSIKNLSPTTPIHHSSPLNPDLLHSSGHRY